MPRDLVDHHHGDMLTTDLRRSRTAGRVAGVCDALGRRWQVDPVLLRVAAVVLALSAGVGLVLYAAGWLLIPEEGHSEPRLFSLAPATRQWSPQTLNAAVAVAVTAVAVTAGSVFPLGLGPLAVCALVWWFGIRPRTQAAVPADTRGPLPSAPTDPFSGPDTRFTIAARHWQQRVWAHQSGAPAPEPEMAVTPPARQVVDPRAEFLSHPDPVGLYTTPVVAPRATPAPSDDRPARRLRAVTLVTLATALTSLALLHALTPLTVPPVGYVATALVILGISLFAATRWGRARGMVTLSLLAILVGLGQAATPPEVVDRLTTTQTHTPPVVRGSDQFSVGDHVIDLTDAEITPGATYRVHVDVGQLTVIVPNDVTVEVNGTVDVGNIRMAHQHSSGVDVEITGRTGSGGTTIHLDASVAVGQLVVVTS